MGTNTPHTCIPGLVWQKQARRFSQFDLKVGELGFPIHFVCVSAALYHGGGGGGGTRPPFFPFGEYGPFCEQCGFFFSPGSPRQQFPLPANLHRRPRSTHFQQDETSSLLDRRSHESHQTYRSYQLVLHLGTSTTLFPAVWTKTVRSIEQLFSQWTRPKRGNSDQRTDEEDTSETFNNNHVGGRALPNALKRNWGTT